jgi:hypothetical protein
MSSIVEFVLKLNDMMAPGLGKLGKISGAVFSGIDKDISKTKRGLDDLGKPVKISVDTSGLKSASRDIESMSQKMGGMGFGKTAGAMALGSFGAQAGMMAMRKGLEFGRDALNSGMEYQKAIVGLSTFVGDKNAYSIVDRVAREGTRTPYTTAQLLPIERGLIAMGSSMDRAHQDTWSLANAVAATGGGDFALQRMGWHMQQASGQGYMDGRIMREFFMAGIPITKLLQASMPELKNMTQAKALDKLDNMTISYDLVSNALLKASQNGGMFAGAMDKLSQTIPGKWSTFIDKMQISGWKLTESQDRNIKLLEDRMIGFADRLPAIAASMSGDINTIFQRADELLPSAKDFGSSLLDVLKPLKDFALSPAFTQLTKSVFDLSAAILNTPILKQGLGLIGDAAQGAANIAGKELGTYKNWLNYVFNHDQYNHDNDPGIKTSVRKFYQWGDLPIGARGGVDSAAYRHITDSLGANNFYKDKAQMDDFEDNYLRKYYPKTAVERYTLPLPVKNALAETFGKNKAGKAGNSELEDTSNAIVGGGRKVVNINFKNFVEHMNNHFSNAKEGLEFTERNMKEMFVRVLRSADGAVN